MQYLTASLVMSLLALGSMAGISQTHAQTVSSTQQHKHVPRYYQKNFGDHQFTTLLDGSSYQSKAIIKDIPAVQADQTMKKYYVDQAKGIQTSVNAFLVNTAKKLVLVDSGSSS